MENWIWKWNVANTHNQPIDPIDLYIHLFMSFLSLSFRTHGGGGGGGWKMRTSTISLISGVKCKHPALHTVSQKR